MRDAVPQKESVLRWLAVYGVPSVTASAAVVVLSGTRAAGPLVLLVVAVTLGCVAVGKFVIRPWWGRRHRARRDLDHVLRQIDGVKGAIQNAANGEHVLKCALVKWLIEAGVRFEVLHVRSTRTVAVGVSTLDLEDESTSGLQSLRLQIRDGTGDFAINGTVVELAADHVVVELDEETDRVHPAYSAFPIEPEGRSDLDRQLGHIIYTLEYDLLPPDAVRVRDAS